MKRNFILDWNNKNAIVVKKIYKKNCIKPGTWENLEVEQLRSNGFTIKDGTAYSVGKVDKIIWENSFFSQALATI